VVVLVVVHIADIPQVSLVVMVVQVVGLVVIMTMLVHSTGVLVCQVKDLREVTLPPLIILVAVAERVPLV
jgi:hypothetical protein